MRSNDWSNRAHAAIHHGSLTNSKRPECFVRGIYPTHLRRGNGAHVIDSNGNKYLDFICSLGANLLGHCNSKIRSAIVDQLDKGLVFSLGSTKEVEAAELLKEIFYNMGRVRFLKTGTEACMAAIKIARSHHGVRSNPGVRLRPLILSDAYHGWSDPFIGLTEPRCGVVQDQFVLPLKGNEDKIKIAAGVIIEPVITDNGPERMQYLQNLREECTKHGTLLIFDEIITGFRYIDWSVSLHTGIRPDILLLGKAMGGGLPLSAVLTAPGIGDDQDWFVSSTFAGDVSALVAFESFVDQLRTSHKIEKLWFEGERFKTEFNNLSDIVKIEGYSTRGVLVGSDLNKALFMQEACKAGILFGPSWFYNFPLIEFNDIVLSSCRDIFMRIKNNQVQLEGEMPVKAFAQTLREKK